MKISLIVIVLAFFGNSTFNQWKTLESEEYFIMYPGDWTLDQSGQGGSSFFLLQKALEGKLFRNNINLIIQDLSGQNIDLAKFVTLSVEQIPHYFPTGVVISSATEGDVHKIVYTGDHGQNQLKFKQFYWVKNEKAFILTYTSEEKSYDESITLADEIMATFKIK